MRLKARGKRKSLTTAVLQPGLLLHDSPNHEKISRILAIDRKPQANPRVLWLVFLGVVGAQRKRKQRRHNYAQIFMSQLGISVTGLVGLTASLSIYASPLLLPHAYHAVAAEVHDFSQHRLPQTLAARTDELDNEPSLELRLTNKNTDPAGATHRIYAIHDEMVYRQTSHPDYQLPPMRDASAPVYLRVPTNQPVVFLTIDDGAVKDPVHLSLIKAANLKVSLFLADSFIHSNPTFFDSYLQSGFPIENHSRDHILKRHLPLGTQVDQICSEAAIQNQQFGNRPLFYRPPGGFYDTSTQRAAASCGMKAIIMWHAKAESGKMMYQDGNHLLPGDIVLMHFRPEFPQDLAAFLEAQKAAGLHTELLEDWLR